MASRPVVALTGFAIPLAAVLCWQAIESAGLLDFEYLPSPREVLSALAELVRSGELARDVSHTLGIAVLAAAIAMILGAVLGFGIGLIPVVGRYTMAGVDFLRTIPAVALVPVAVLTLGPISSTEVALATYAALWPIVLHTAAGVATVHPRLYDVARMLHMPPLTTLRKIVVPATVPAWLVGARMSVIIAMLVAIVTEMVMYSKGLGGGLIESLHALAPARLWAYALVCAAIGALLAGGLRHGVRLALPGDPVRGGGDQPTPAPPVTALRGLLPIGVALAALQVTASRDSLSVPPPSEWARAIGRMASVGQLAPAATHTLATFAFGLLMAVIVGVTVGVLIGRSVAMDRLLSPTIDFIAAIPGAALVPVAVLLLGPDLVSGIVVVALIVSWPILLNTAAAMRAIPVVRLEMAVTIGLSPINRWLKVVFPSLLPGIMLGLRFAASLAVIITLLVDIFSAGTGIGRLLVESQQHFDSAAAWGLLLIVGGFGYLMSVVTSSSERYSMQRESTRPNCSRRCIWARPPLSTDLR